MDRIQFRRDTLDNWNSVNPILLEGEIGYVLDDPNLYKMGDGIKTWDQLPFRGFDGTIVQETGSNENAVMSQKATSDKFSQLEQKEEYLLSLSKKCQKEFNTTITGADSVYIPVSLERGDICHVKNLSSAYCSVYLKDSYGNIVQSISEGALLQNESIDFSVDTDDAVTIGGYCSTGYELEFSLKSPVSLNSINSLSLDLSLNLAKQYIYNFANDTPLNLVENKIIAPSGIVKSVADSAPFHVSDSIAITSGEKLNILASALYGNCYYAIYDENNTVLLREKQTGSVYEKQITIVAPENSHHICVSWVGGYSKSTLSIASKVENGKIWNGIKWVCFGDSLTEKSNRTAKKRYYDFVSEELGITPLDYGKSGTGYFKAYGNNQNFLTRIEDLANVDFDVITFFGSFNDLDGGWIGGSTDSTDISSNDICGFINATLDRLYEIKPFVKVGIITPTPWYNSFTLKECSEYATKLKQIAEKRSIPCLDLFRCSNLHPDKENFREKFYNEDGVQDNGTHPNSLGHLRIYPQFREFLKSML